MQAAYQSTISCSAERHDEEMTVKSVLISTDYEMSAQVVVDVGSFDIKYARWDAFRTPQGYTFISKELPDLIGLDAYIYSGKQVRQAVGEEMNGIPLELMIECIRGVGQAEAFVIPERGFPILKDFDDYCQMIGKDSCRYYSNLDKIAMRWTEYMGEHSFSRNKGLFDRHKNYQIFSKPDGSFWSTAGFTDTFHEIMLLTSFTQDGLVADCTGNFMRGPDKICFENVMLLSDLVGANLTALNKRDLAGLVGGPLGCTHLYEMLWDLGRAMNEIMDKNS
jgi:hypothetical protein